MTWHPVRHTDRSQWIPSCLFEATTTTTRIYLSLSDSPWLSGRSLIISDHLSDHLLSTTQMSTLLSCLRSISLIQWIGEANLGRWSPEVRQYCSYGVKSEVKSSGQWHLIWSLSSDLSALAHSLLHIRATSSGVDRQLVPTGPPGCSSIMTYYTLG